MEPASHRRTRGQRKNTTSTPSPLRELPASTRQRARISTRNNKKDITSENDNADAQSQLLSATDHHVTSPSQSPQPHESHSEPERIIESRSTSPSDQQQSSQTFVRPSTRSTSPSRIPKTNGKASATPKTDGKKKAGRPKGSVKQKGLSTHQGVGTPKAQGGKRSYKDMANASDADGEEAGDERPPFKHHKTVHSPIQQNNIHRDEQGAQLVPSTKRKFEPSAHQSAGSDGDSDGPTTKRQRQHQRPSESKISSPTPGHRNASPRASTFSKGPFSYSGAPLKASPSAQNPFAMVPAHQPFRSPSRVASPSHENSAPQRSLTTANESNAPISTGTQLAAIEYPSSTPAASRELVLHETTTEADQFTPIKSTIKKRSIRNAFPTPSKNTLGDDESTQITNSFPDGQNNIFHTSAAVSHKSCSTRPAANQPIEEVVAVSEKGLAAESQLAAADFDSEQDSSSSLAPFVFHVKERLPPKPSSRPQREIPTLPKPATPFIQHTQPDAFDFEDSIVMSDDEADIDMEASKRKGRAWKEDYRRVKALEKEAKLAREKLQRGEALGPEFNKKSSSSREISRKQGKMSSASRNSMRLSNSQPTLVFPALGSLNKITVTNPNIIGFLRAVHDHVAVGNTSNTLPDPREVVALLHDSTSNQSSETTALSGQKAGTQRGFGRSAPMAQTPSKSRYNDMDFSEEELSPDEDEDTMTDITSGVGSREVPAIPAVPVTPSTPATKSGGWLSSLKSGVQSLMTPFAFKGSSRATNATETDAPKTEVASKGNSSHITNANKTDASKTDFTFSHEHNIVDSQVTPTRPSRRKVKAHSERRSRTQPARTNAPQTERKRRQPQSKTKTTHTSPLTEEGRKLMELLADPEWQRQRHERALQAAHQYEETVKAANAAKAASAKVAKAASEFANATSQVRAKSRTTRNTEVETEVHSHNSFRAPDFSDDSDDEDVEPSPSKNTLSLAPAETLLSGSNEAESQHTGTFKAPDYDDDETDTDTDMEEENDPALKDATWTQTPPPKPRPSNAQLPFQKYVPKKPSGLRNVTAMSPIQKVIEGEDDGHIQEAVNKAMGNMTQVVWKPVVAGMMEIEDERVRELCPEHVQRAVLSAF